MIIGDESRYLRLYLQQCSEPHFTGLSVISHKKKATFWRELVGLFPRLIDFLCLCDDVGQVDRPFLVSPLIAVARSLSGLYVLAKAANVPLSAVTLSSARQHGRCVALLWLYTDRCRSPNRCEIVARIPGRRQFVCECCSLQNALIEGLNRSVPIDARALNA